MVDRLAEAAGYEGKFGWLYQQLRREIESGYLRHGQALPSQAELVRRFLISIGTVRDVVGRLAEIGRVIKSQGRRTTVYMPEPRHRIVVERRLATIATAPLVAEPDSPFLSVMPAGDAGYQWIEDTFTVPVWEAEKLGFEAGIAVRRRVLIVSIGDDAVLTSSSFLPMGVAGQAGGWRSTLVGDLAVTGLAAIYAATHVHVRIPTLAEAGLLGIVAGIPVFAFYRRCTVFHACDPAVALPACVLVVARGDHVFLDI